ncbi:MAG: alpha-2-macroglobulin [Chloroflexi bacterium]|nr:alpha-2-macroglobulin [Chloroflexota bacterium]
MAGRISRRTVLTATAATGAVAAGAGALALWNNRPAPDPIPLATPAPGATPVVAGATPTVAPTTAPVATGAADGYVAIAPRTLRAGQTEAVSVSLFGGGRPTRDAVTVALAKDGKDVATVTGEVNGRGALPLALPALPAGDYQLKVSAQRFTDTAAVRVEDGTMLFLETDKPIYKPGQTVHIRLLTLDPALRPVAGPATVEVMDAKGIKVFKKPVAVDAYGMAGVDLPLSTEPNLGVWKVRALAGQRQSQLDVRVERYVLPKYEVTVSLAKEWALVGEAIPLTVAAEYTFGKPVTGEVEVVAARYVGTWQEYARVTRPLDGKLALEAPPVRFAAGTPAAGGLSNVRLDVTVTEQATGYKETTSRLVTIAANPVVTRAVPESVTFKPGLPFSVLIVAETPGKQPVDTAVQVRLSSVGENLRQLSTETRTVTTRNGVALVEVTPPAGALTFEVQPAQGGAQGPLTRVYAGFSPSSTFIHVQQVTAGPLRVGDTARFKVHATKEATNLYYEVVARGAVIFSDLARAGGEIALPLTPRMAPEARLLVYQLQATTSEVAADYLPFRVEGRAEHTVAVSFDKAEALPGDEVTLSVTTDGEARVGLAGVDRAVFVLAENRLNLRQVFDELERLYQKPQIELHEARPIGPPQPPVAVAPRQPAPAPPAGVAREPMPPIAGPIGPSTTIGAKEIFQNAGVVVLTNRQVPAGKVISIPGPAMGAAREVIPAAAPKAAAPAAAAPQDAASDGLAEVQRVRQFFPETWLWSMLTTSAAGAASQRVTAPDSITTWQVRAVALSKDKGLGISETTLKVFQPFFVQVDLPYSAVRGEEFPVSLALYNYLGTPQEITVELEAGDWFDLLGARVQTVTVPANGVGAARFGIRPTGLGPRAVKVTARSRAAADAIIKELLIEPEGIQREIVENLTLPAGTPRTLDLSLPVGIIPGSGRVFLAVTGNVLSQTINGLEGLLRMPFGCGEQNMLLFAPNVFIGRYLKETGQLKPEVMAKAEVMMLTGYQRQLTYRRNDGSFSAFGQSDKEGSLWLSAFVLKTFAQARDLLFIDDAVLNAMRGWIARVQRPDGSFEPVGFVHHQELLGGLKGTTALTGFVAVALAEAGETAAAGKAISYLEKKLDETTDAYATALSAYALTLAKSGRAADARAKLLGLARETPDGLTWGPSLDQPPPMPAAAVAPGGRPVPPKRPDRGAAIETTGYAALALLAGGDRLAAGRAAQWLASQRNALGGFGSTQDTIVALQALTTAAASARADIDATVKLTAGGFGKDVRIAPDNADTLQVIDLPAGGDLQLEPRGKGTLTAQLVKRFNVPAAEAAARSAFQVEVRYGAEQVAVNDLLTITASVRFTPPEPVAAGMVVLDVAVPTGFAPETPTLEALAKGNAKLKRWEIAGRKVILYIEDMQPDERLIFAFQARALYPVKAQAVGSQAYAYYRPEWAGESLGGALTVAARGR